ncbi:MAG: hypothetical protein WBO45_04610, partial [Planctomycetota bacterium]
VQHCLQRLVAGTTARERTSQLLTEPRLLGERTVVAVRYDYRLQGAAGASATAFREDAMLALRCDGTSRVVPTFEVAIAPGSGQRRSDRFRCPPCNYEVGGAPGWLCVQVRADVASALEAASFYLIGTDVACDVAVQVEPQVRPAATVAVDLAAAMQRLEPSASAGSPVAWTPPAHAGDVIPKLAGARLELQLRGDERVVCHVATFGGLEHLLLVRGSATSLRAHDAAIQALLGSYRLLEHDCDLALAAARPIEHHGGGELVGATYRNSHFGIELVGADGWKPALRTGGAAFRVTWTSPTGSRLWLTGHRVPLGLAAWTTDAADRWLRQLCAQQDLAITDDRNPWCDDTGTADRSRLLVCAPRHAAVPGTPRQRLLRAVLRDDLLIIADGFALTAADEADLRTMLAAVRRR